MKKIVLVFLCFILNACELFVIKEKEQLYEFKNVVHHEFQNKQENGTKKITDSINRNVVTDINNLTQNFKHTPVNEYNNIAMKIAGIYAPDEFMNDPIYVDYVNFLNDEWNRLSCKSISLITKWSNDNISKYIKNIKTIFYPFGGPDVTYALNFFPCASTFVLVGLERIGSMSKIKTKLSNTAVFPYLKNAMKSYLKKGYFITSEMMQQLSINEMNGALYVILLQLAKLGFEIKSVEELFINQNGDVILSGKRNVNCAKIICAKGNSNDVKTIFYIRMDICNDNTGISRLIKFLNKYSFGTFIKSASYALHDRSLSKCKNFILSNSRFVLQDDSGVPFEDFSNTWDLRVFGSYTKPTLPVFKWYEQKALADFFIKTNPKKLPFKIGYGFNKKEPNLLLAVSKINQGKSDVILHGLVNQPTTEIRKGIVDIIHEIRKNSKEPCISCGDKKDNETVTDNSVESDSYFNKNNIFEN